MTPADLRALAADHAHLRHNPHEVAAALLAAAELIEQQRRPLTDEQIAQISVYCALVTPSDVYFARAIEAAHDIKEAT